MNDDLKFTLKLGKLPVQPAHVQRAMKFANYLPATLPPIPLAYDQFSNVYASLGMSASDLKTLFPMDGNGPDHTLQPPLDPSGYGDCVAVMMAKASTIFKGLVGQKLIPTATAVVKQYLVLTDGEDSGLNISDTIDYGIKNGLFGEKPVAKMYIDPSNYDHLRLGIYLAGCLLTGIQVDDKMQQQFMDRKPWDGSGKRILGGHGIPVSSYDADGNFRCLTWADDQLITLAGWQKRVDETWIVASQEMIENAPKFCPGFNADQLLADLKAIADQE